MNTPEQPHVQPTLQVHMGPDGLPCGAVATGFVERPAEQLWAVILDVDRFPVRIPMIDRVRRDPRTDRERVSVDLRFKVTVVSVGYGFVADVVKTETVAATPPGWRPTDPCEAPSARLPTATPPGWRPTDPCEAPSARLIENAPEPTRTLELKWVSGEPRNIHLRFHVVPSADGQTCTLTTQAAFDVRSLGWLAKYFLKHHPEIQYGIFPGVALALFDSIRRVVCDRPLISE